MFYCTVTSKFMDIGVLQINFCVYNISFINAITISKGVAELILYD